jgi:hypothetical protein
VRVEDKLLILCALPNMSEEHIREACKILRGGIDWDYFLKKTIQNKIFPQTYEHLSRTPELDQFVSEDLKKAYQQSMVANLLLRNEAGKALKALSKQKIVYTPFKGFLLDLLIYPNDITRDFGDIDLLFKNEREKRRAEKVLLRLGYKNKLDAHSIYHTVLQKKLFGVNIVIELHISLPGITYLYQYPIIEDFWETLTETEIEGSTILVMPPEYMVLVIALHAFREGGFSLKDLSDLRAITDSIKGFNWVKIKEYMNKRVWNYILAIPFYAYISSKEILNEEWPSELGAVKRFFSIYPYEQAYPLSYSIICDKFISCNRECQNCIFLFQRKIPGFPEILLLPNALRYFPIRLKISSSFLATYVLRDYGAKYTFQCYMNIMKALIEISLFAFKSMINTNKHS